MYTYLSNVQFLKLQGKLKMKSIFIVHQNIYFFKSQFTFQIHTLQVPMTISFPIPTSDFILPSLLAGQNTTPTLPNHIH